MGFGSSFRKFRSGILKGKGNPLADAGALVHEAYSAPGDDTAKALPSKYRETYRRNMRRGLMAASLNTSAGIYDKSKSEGYTDKEAATNASMFGLGHSQVSAGAKARQAGEAQEVQAQEMSRQQAAQELADRNAQGLLIRRRRNRADPTKGGTLLTGSLGLPGRSATGTQLGIV